MILCRRKIHCGDTHSHRWIRCDGDAASQCDRASGPGGVKYYVSTFRVQSVVRRQGDDAVLAELNLSAHRLIHYHIWWRRAIKNGEKSYKGYGVIPPVGER